MNTRSNDSKGATKSVSEVPGQEMERWGLTVDAWEGFSSQGKTELALYEGTLDAHAYQDILKNSLLLAAQAWFGDETEGWELQQDKASCHTATVHHGLVGVAWG